MRIGKGAVLLDSIVMLQLALGPVWLSAMLNGKSEIGMPSLVLYQACSAFLRSSEFHLDAIRGAVALTVIAQARQSHQTSAWRGFGWETARKNQACIGRGRAKAKCL